MELAEWSQALFEATYPKFKFPGGLLHWVSSDELKLVWGSKEYNIEAKDFYSEYDKDPTSSILNWVYSSLPILPDEIGDTYIYWDHIASSFVSETIRGQDIVYRQKHSYPNIFPNYSENIIKNFNFKLVGTLLHVTSKEGGISPLCVLSHPIALEKSLERFFDFGENIHLIYPFQHKDDDKIIIGNKNSINRLKEDKESLMSISLPQWKQEITKMFEQLNTENANE